MLFGWLKNKDDKREALRRSEETVPSCEDEEVLAAIAAAVAVVMGTQAVNGYRIRSFRPANTWVAASRYEVVRRRGVM